VIEPTKEAGMYDYRLDAIERPERHPTAVDRLTGRGAARQRSLQPCARLQFPL
jgi:hypothetical protein